MNRLWNVLGAIALVAWTLVSISMLTGVPVGLLTVISLGALGLTGLIVALWPPRVDGDRAPSAARRSPSTPEDRDPNRISRGNR